MTACTPCTSLKLLHQHSQKPLELIPESGIVMTPGGITEICGSAGCGKTQMALALCVRSLLLNDDDENDVNEHDYSLNVKKKKKVAMYISTSGEGPIPHSRLEQFLSHYYRCRSSTHNHRRDNHLGDSSDNDNDHLLVLQRILTRTVHTIDDLMEFIINRKLDISFEEYDLAVLVIDSIGGLFRGEYNENISLALSKSSSTSTTTNGKDSAAATRAGLLFSLAAHLKKLSSANNFPVVTINQVTADFSNQNANAVKAALGLSWSCCVNSRYLLTRHEISVTVPQARNDEKSRSQMPKQISNPYRKRSIEPNRNEGNEQVPSSESDMALDLSSTRFRRYIQILFSPSLSSSNRTEYRIEKGGVFIVQ